MFTTRSLASPIRRSTRPFASARISCRGSSFAVFRRKTRRELGDNRIELARRRRDLAGLSFIQFANEFAVRIHRRETGNPASRDRVGCQIFSERAYGLNDFAREQRAERHLRKERDRATRAGGEICVKVNERAASFPLWPGACRH